jgi:hypothetical protein
MDKTQKIVRVSVEYDVISVQGQDTAYRPTGRIRPEGKGWTTMCAEDLEKIA